jgi:Transposase DDE domain
LIGGFGRHLVAMRRPWTHHGRAAAVDSTPLKTRGGVWHQQHRETGAVPQTSLDTAAGWSQSGWHGWWYGWKLHLAVSVGAVWLPLAAALTPANTADNAVASPVLAPLPAEGRDILGETASHAPEVRNRCEPATRVLVATRRGAYPHHDDGVEVRRLFHQLRSQAIEPCNGLFKNVVEWRTQMPVKGLRRSQLLALGAIAVSQLVWFYPHEHHLPLGKGMKPLLRAA